MLQCESWAEGHIHSLHEQNCDWKPEIGRQGPHQVDTTTSQSEGIGTGEQPPAIHNWQQERKGEASTVKPGLLRHLCRRLP